MRIAGRDRCTAVVEHVATPRPADEEGMAEIALNAPTVDLIMSSPGITIDSGATLREAEDRLHTHDIHHLLVEYRGRVVAVLSDRDVLRAVSPFRGTLSEQTRDTNTMLRRVFQFASFDLVTVHRDAPILEAAALLLERDISCLPVVVDDGEVCGVVTTRDLLRGMLECRITFED